MIEIRHLTKRYGDTTAVDDLSFEVKPGQVTGFLGPNGAGKSTTMRLILGLDRPDRGHALVTGRPYRECRSPLREVGALLEAAATHPGRRAEDHLLWLAHTNRIRRSRVDEVLDQVGLSPVARKRTGTFSLGMAQRLGIAAALLGDPPVLILDEPMNGLDPEGIVWIRGLLADFAAQGRTVFVSSHLMGEMSQVADHLVVIRRGRLVADATLADVVDRHASAQVRIRSPRAEQLVKILADHGIPTSTGDSPDQIVATGVASSDVGVPRAVVGAGLFAAAVAVLGVALGALIRHAVGAITVVVAVLFVSQMLFDALPSSWSDVTRFVPHWAGFAVFTLRPDDDMLAPWAGFAVFSAYTAAVLAAAALLLQHRDT